MPAQARKADHDVLRKVLVNLEELAVVHHAADDLLDVVRLVGVIRHDGVQHRVGAQWVVARFDEWRILHVVGGQIPQQQAQQVKTIAFALGGHVGYAADAIVHQRSSQLFEGDILVRHGFDHVGACDEHVAGVLHHEDKVGQRGRIDCAPCAWPHDEADLRDDAAGLRVAQEDIRVTHQRQHPFLDTRPAGVVDADDGRAVLQRHLLQLDNLGCVGLAQAAAHDGEVL